MSIDNYIYLTDENSFRIEQTYNNEEYYTYKVSIRSGDFSGSTSFCLSKNDMMKFIDTLAKMYSDLSGKCEIHDNDSDSFVSLECCKFGHIIIMGQIGGSYQDHFMKFKYEADQTAIYNLMKAFKIT
jgi:hypothetical protein